MWFEVISGRCPTKELTLEKAIEIATSYEAIEKGSKEMQGNPPTNEVAEVKDQKINRKTCYRCGRGRHTPYVCRFKDLTCHKCGKVGHIANACKTKTTAGRPSHPFKRHGANVVAREEDTE